VCLDRQSILPKTALHSESFDASADVFELLTLSRHFVFHGCSVVND